MDKKPSQTVFAIRLTVILAFFAVLIFPLCLMALDGPDETAMESEKETKLVPFTAESYADGSFQSNFEAWFSAHYPLRSSIVRTYRQMQYDLENTAPVMATMQLLNGQLFHRDDPDEPGKDDPGTDDPGKDNPGTDDPGKPDDPDDPTKDPMWVYINPSNIYAEINLLQMTQQIKEPTGFKGSDAVYIGKSGYLFERSYMDEYMGYSKPYTSVTDEGLEVLVERLEYIQAELEKRGITMLYVISSSKASQYSEYIPEWYKNKNVAAKDYVRPIDRLRPMLEKSKIHYLDSSEYYREIGLLVTFPKTGIHWNALAAFESTAKLLQMYQSISGKTIKTLTTKGVLSSSSPFNQGNPEQDVFNILYGSIQASGKIVDDAYYAPDIVVRNQNAGKINVLVQGGSFTHSIMYYLNQYQVANATQIYYNGLNGTGSFGGHSPWEQGPEAWDYWLKNTDLIIFEATEQQIRSEHASGRNWLADAQNGSIGHNAVYDSLYQYLKAHEGEY